MKNKQIYLIAILLFSSSYVVFSTNIQNQGIYIDENFHHTFGMTYYDLLQSGDFTGPCMTGLGECPIINHECIGEMQWIGSGGIVKGLLVGLGDDLFSNNDIDHKNYQDVIYSTHLPPNTPLRIFYYYFKSFCKLLELKIKIKINIFAKLFKKNKE